MFVMGWRGVDTGDYKHIALGGQGVPEATDKFRVSLLNG